jgi:probable phosphoglycerate mutase
VVLALSLVRHGQTVYNAENRMQGWCDSPLTPAGLAGVRTTADHLADRPFVAAYASPSGRAQATARQILAHHRRVPLTTDPDLRELNFGELEARPGSELAARHDPDAMFDELLAGTFPGIPDGESASEFLARVSSAFARIEHAHADGQVLVVSHGLTLLTYLMMIDERPKSPLPNASISTVLVRRSGVRRVVVVGLDLAGGEGLPDDVDASPRPEPALG